MSNKFSGEKVETLVSDVYANIGELKLPFIGVTGVSACPNIKRADTGEPAPCPLEANEEYVYTNVFPIEKYYPNTRLIVYWSLNDGNKQVICFEVPAVITSAAS
ncbi:hypothetical protein O3G_MSEX006348 [Manduca sexta]|uniref:MD-2-related lipid-recognition domain-containing protein n=1 Tax=Manduca sexta TaxID=7130 RepID=A0A921Z2Y8_MANSE|nr:hypothetical protein O3G_MSEX006348 [Manduca sexta]KAG6450027.1 hypothetical protein O3G_MSEX006348 [Manduca sexta]